MNHYREWVAVSLFRNAFAAGVLLSGTAAADTVGLYTFDTIGDATDTVGGQYFHDLSGNNLTLRYDGSLGINGISSNVPEVAPAESLVLGAQHVTGFDSSPTDLFSIGRTGELSIEFWYKPMIADTIRIIAAQADGNNAWSLYQTVPQAGKAGLEFYAITSTGTPVRVSTPTLYSTNTPWTHIAVTVDAVGTGRFYQDGVEIASGSGFTGFAPYVAPLRLGAQPSTGGFSGNFLMDDFRISDVALPGGSGSGIGELAWNTSLSRGLQSNVERPADFGKQWLRKHPFTISSWGSTSDLADLPLYESANMTSAMSGWYAAHQAYDIDQHYLGAYVELNDTSRKQMQIASNLPRLTAWMIKDEIAPGDIPGVARIADYIRSIDPDGLIYAGMGSSNPAYISQVVQAVKPDALIHGYYPFTGTGGTDVDGHFSDFVYFRAGALQHDLPFFVYVQSFDDSGTIENRRLPSESELRFDTFTKLTGGAQGIAYFVFDAGNGGPGVTNALLNRQGEPSSLYESARQMNAEVLNVGRVLRFIETSDWRYVPGMTGAFTNRVPQDMIGFSPNAAIDLRVLSVSVDTADAANRGALKDGVIGWFHDESDLTYFMLTNVYHGTELSSAETSLDFLVRFDETVEAVLRVNRLTGEPEKLALDPDHILRLTLPGGTGDLFKYHDGVDFAGIPSGDVDLSGRVDLDDLAGFVTWYGLASGGRWRFGDFDFDGDVDGDDLSRLADNYFLGREQALADFDRLMNVPEPSAGLLAALGFMVGASRLPTRHRRRSPGRKGDSNVDVGIR